MKPASPVIKGYGDQETVYGASQSQYEPLPALRVSFDGIPTVISRWRLSWRERLRVFFTGSVWLGQMTFGDPLQPVQLMAKPPQVAPPGPAPEISPRPFDPSQRPPLGPETGKSRVKAPSRHDVVQFGGRAGSRGGR